jgi:hypothetical protein
MSFKNWLRSLMMKRVSFVALALLAVFMVVSCGGSPKAEPRLVGLPDIVRNARRNAPEGVLIGIGSAKLATQNQSKTVAETRARAEISRAMETVVQDMVRDYTASSEIDPSAALGFQEQITVALSKSKLQGSVISDEDFIDGTYYVVVYLSKSDVVREINQAQAAAKLAVPAMASFSAETRMNEAFDRESGKEPRVADRD